MSYSIKHADIVEWAATYDGPPFHALLCDAPYEMEFMGKGWDNSGIAFDPETWKAIARCLHPGAFLFVFAGTVNDDLISVAMRQAGLRKYHRAGAWSYGSGFPKAARLDTVIDRRAGVERTKIGQRRHQPKFAAKEFDYRKKDNGYNSKDRETFDVTRPATDLAHAWAGHRYGGQPLKPALESILIFQKPYAGDAAASITATGAGALWIDGGRVGTGGQTQWAEPRGGIWRTDAAAQSEALENSQGRWPANLVLAHHPACNGACHPDCAVLALGRQSGESSETARVLHRNGKRQMDGWGLDAESQGVVHGDTGTAARFFYQADWMAERLEDADAVIYEAKAGRSEREAGLDPRQVRLLDSAAFDEATINDGRQTPIDNAYQRGQTTRRNVHPTIKPIALARHLATLLLPPDLYAPRRILIPFAGAGSEMIGALLAGWEEIVGVELEAEHVRIAEARLAYWQQRRHEFGDPSKPIAASLSDAPDGQLDLFGDDL